MAKTLKRSAEPSISSSTTPNSRSDTSAEYGNIEMLDIHQAATLMQCTRAYVAMLMDAEKLVGGTISTNGQRQIPRASVMQWINENPVVLSSVAGKANFRKAALEAGMYAIPDEVYLKVMRRNCHSVD